jgi:tetratricopeptide (TPR) repeat protein
LWQAERRQRGVDVIGQTVSQYVVKRLLGRGGMGEVYLAHDTTLDRLVALKFLPEATRRDETALRRFVREAKAAAAIDHPYVCKIYEIHRSPEQTFISMEFVEGEALAQRLRRAPMSFAEANRIMGEIAEAVKQAHASKLVHRDLKPGNVMLATDGHVKVMDFGLAKRAICAGEDTLTETGLTVGGTLMGTLAYMAPEQLRGVDADGRSDIFALGVILYEMWTGAHPFKGDSPFQTAAAILEGRLPSLRGAAEIDSRAEGIIARTLAADPRDRYQSIEQFLEDLRDLGKSVDSSGRAASATGIRLDPVSVVALPAQVFAADADQFLADAIPNAISTQLVTVQGLETKRPPRKADVDRLGGDVDRVAAMFGASSYVLSSVTAFGDALSLNLQIVEARTRRLTWSRSFEGTRDRYIELVRRAAEGIRSALQPAATRIDATATTTGKSEVELLLQRAQYHLYMYINRGRESDFEHARDTFQAVMDLDPGRAAAPAGLARLHSVRIFTGAGSDSVAADMERWARQALALDPRSGTAWCVLADVEQLRRPNDYRVRLEYALKAAAFAPEEAFTHTSLAGSLSVNSTELGLAACREASRLDPLGLEGPVYEALTLTTLGRWEEALARIDAALKLEPDMLLATFSKEIILQESGQLDEAERLLARLEPMVAEGRFNSRWVALSRDLITFTRAARQGERAAADSMAASLRKLALGEDPFPRWENLTQRIAARLSSCHRPDEAVGLLEERQWRGIVDPYDHLLDFLPLKSLRGDPRFERVLARSRSRFDEMVTLIREAVGRGDAPAYLEHALEALLSRLPKQSR